MKGKKMPKIIAQLTAAFLALAMLLGGTYAWKDYRQHKTNELSNSGKNYDAALVEDFKEDKDWEEGETVNKKVSVKNNATLPTGGDIYVRLMLKEYMEISPVIYTYSPDRYMIDTNGEFIRYDLGADAIKFVNDNNLSNPNSRVAYYSPPPVTDPDALQKTLPKAGYYIKTFDSDINGQYGKFLITEISYGTADQITSDEHKRYTDSIDPWMATRPDDDTAEPLEYAWDKIKFADTTPDVRKYVQLNWGSDVITYGEWQDTYGGYPIDKWIYVVDAYTAVPYYYWGQPLKPGEMAPNLLESVTLLTQPEGKFYYGIRVDMEALSKDDLVTKDEWGIVGKYTAYDGDSYDEDTHAYDTAIYDAYNIVKVSTVDELKAALYTVDPALAPRPFSLRSSNDLTGAGIMGATQADLTRKTTILLRNSIDLTGAGDINVNGNHKIDLNKFSLFTVGEEDITFVLEDTETKLVITNGIMAARNLFFNGSGDVKFEEPIAVKVTGELGFEGGIVSTKPSGVPTIVSQPVTKISLPNKATPAETQKAISDALKVENAVVYLPSGDYDVSGPSNNLQIDKKGATIIGDPDTVIKAIGSGTGKLQQAIMVNAKDVTISSVTIKLTDADCAQYPAKGIEVHPDADNVTISNCVFDYSGVYTAAAAASTTNPMVKAYPIHGLYMAGLGSYTIKDNMFINCTLTLANGAGTEATNASDLIVSGNGFDGGAIVFNQRRDPARAWITADSVYPTIEGNTFKNLLNTADLLAAWPNMQGFAPAITGSANEYVAVFGCCLSANNSVPSMGWIEDLSMNNSGLTGATKTNSRVGGLNTFFFAG